MRFCLLSVLLIFLTNTSISQDSSRVLNATPGEIKINKPSFFLPFRLKQNHIIIENLTINGKTGHFIFDLGNQTALVVDQNQFASGLSPYQSSRSKGATGTINNLQKLKVDSFSFGEATYQSFEAVALDLKHVRNEIGAAFIGFIGAKIFQDYEITIDYSTQLIQLVKVDSLGQAEPLTDSTKRYCHPIQVKNGSILLAIEINKKPVLFLLDSGAPQNYITTSLAKGLSSKYLKLLNKTDTLTGADNHPVVTQLAKLRNIKLGKHSFEEMETAVYNFDEREYDGQLGYPFLSQKKFTINYRKKTLCFEQ